jgi:hypothetical protein
VKDGGPKAVGSPAEEAAAVEKVNLAAEQARARAALEVHAARERREIALTAAALVYRGRRRRSSIGRVLEAAAEFERFLTAG